MNRFRSYIICTSPRSGSTLLCRMLQQIADAGYPDSHFHHPSLDSWFANFGLDATEYDDPIVALRAVFNAADRIGRADAEIFGLRLQRNSFGFFAEQLKLLFPALKTDKARIEAAFGTPLFIHLTRQNKVEQAVSVVKAQQSGLWHKAPDGAEIERSHAPQKLVYDPDAIATEYQEFVRLDEEWQVWFEVENIQPVHINYEALSADPYAELARVLEKLELAHVPAEGFKPPVAKLSDAVNRDWADRFQTHLMLKR